MKTNANNKISVEEALNALSLPAVDEHNMESAQKRVWNQLSHSISKLEKPQNPEKFENRRVVYSMPSRVLRFAMTFVLILLLVAGGSGLFWYIGYNLGNNNNNGAVSTNGQNNTLNVKALAASRFSQLSGVSFDEFTSAIDSTSTPVPTVAQVFSTPQTTQLIPNTKTDVKVDETKVIELAKKAGKSQTSIYYTKQDVQFSSNFSADMALNSFGLGQGKLESIDYSKPLSYETWITSNYSKTKISQNDKTILEYVSTPDYGYSYVGGKYAVQVEYPNQKYTVAGLSDDGTTIANPEIELLKFILTSKNAGNAKLVNENGKDLIIIESDDNFGFILTSTSDIKLKTKFYLDKATFELVRIEQTFGDKLVLTNSNIKSKPLDDKLPTEIFNTFDLKDKVEVKNVASDPAQDLLDIISTQSVKDFTQKYPVLYLDGKQGENFSVLDYSSTDYQKLLSNEKLIQTVDFNPLYINTDTSEKPIANYYFTTLYIDVNLYKSEPDLSEKGKFDITKTDSTVVIDSKNYSGSTYIKAATQISSDKANNQTDKAFGLIFKYNNIWYVFQTKYDSTTTALPFVSENKLIKLSLIDAEKIDAKNNVTPKLNFKSVSLKDIDSKIRFLPGNLKDSYKLEAYFAGMSSTKGANSTCDKNYDAGKVDNDLYLSCLIEKNDGFIVKYQQVNDKNSDQNTIKNLSFIYLNTSKSNAENLLKPLQDTKTQILITEKDGKSFVIISNLTSDQISKIMNGVDLNKDLEILNTQVNSN